MKVRVTAVYNLNAYPVSALPLWKRIALPLVRTQTFESDQATITFKMLLGAMYIIKIVKKVHMNCDHEYCRGRFN